jgi:hypothetical protein
MNFAGLAFPTKIVDSLREIEPWPCFYRFRQTEVEILLHHLNLQRVNTILEIGCGIAFNAVLLSTYAQRYIATDLPEPDPQTHTRGMFLAQRFLDIVGAKNIELVDCSATDLSKIESESVNVVYSSYDLNPYICGRNQSSFNLYIFISGPGLPQGLGLKVLTRG